MRFDELDLSDEVLDALDAMNFDECTPIQELAIPIILDGYDLMAVAQTGTGKTAAYLLPIIDCLAGGGFPEHAINCVVMVPTHELAQQIDRQLQGFSYFLPISSVAIYGGTDGKEFARQQHGLKTGADIVIATPGRLLAHMSMGYVDLSQTSFFVLDEADRMLDMGFYDDIMQIQRKLPQQCQTMMFSATMPPKIQQLANTILYKPQEIKISVSKPADKIDQSAFVCYEGQKDKLLLHLLKTTYSSRVIVFAASKLKVKDLTRELRRRNIKAGEMHSDLDQPARESVIEGFRNGKIDVLVATDIVARGIDIDDITMVVNYDVPHEAEDYVHRVGRTARANSDGKAVTFVSERDQQKFGSIERFLEYEVRKETMPAEVGEGPKYEPNRRNNGRGNASQRGRNANSNSGRGSRNSHNGNRRNNRPTDASKANRPKENSQAQASGGNKQGKRRNFRRRNSSGNKPQGNQ
jgi:superfamily II DNA/RNA helicase